MMVMGLHCAPASTNATPLQQEASLLEASQHALHCASLMHPSTAARACVCIGCGGLPPMVARIGVVLISDGAFCETDQSNASVIIKA